MSFGNAERDIRYLLDRGYPQKGVIAFVCNHYRLDERPRYILSRTVLAREVSEKRQAKFLKCEEISGKNVVIDGYNIIIGMESIIEKKSCICDDGVIRDIKGTFRNFRSSENTDKAIELILKFLKELSPAHVGFLLDSQISKSGSLAAMLRGKICEFGLKGDARTSKHVDFDMKSSKDIVASSDGVIIDAAQNVVNFLYCVVSRFKHLEAGVVRELPE